MNPVRDFAVLPSCWALSLYQFPKKSASAKTSSDLDVSGFSMIPLSQIRCRYFTIFSTTLVCGARSSSVNVAH